MVNARPLLALVTLLPTACTDTPQPEARHASVCDEAGPKLLVEEREAEWGAIEGILGDRLIYSTGSESSAAYHVVGTCGESPAPLENWSAQGDVWAWGETAVVNHSRDRLYYTDLLTGEGRVVLDDVHEMIVPTPHGVLSLGKLGGPLWLHPDPSDPDAQPRALIDATIALTSSTPANPHELWSDGEQTLAVDPDGRLHRIGIATGEDEELLEGIEHFRVVDGGRQILMWSQDELVLHHLDTGDELMLGNVGYDIIYIGAAAGPWLMPLLEDEVLVHLGRHETIPIDTGGGEEMWPIDDDRVLLRQGSFDARDFVFVDCRYDLLHDDGTMTPLAERMPCLDPIVREDGFVAPTGDDPYDVMLYPFDGGEPELLGSSYSSGYLLFEDQVLSFQDTGSLANIVIDDEDSDPRLVQSHAVSMLSSGEDLFYYVVGHGPMRTRLED